MGIFPYPLLRLLRALPALNTFAVSVIWFELVVVQVLRQISVADRLVLLVTDCLITLEAELVSDMKHPFCVHMCV